MVIKIDTIRTYKKWIFKTRDEVPGVPPKKILKLISKTVEKAEELLKLYVNEIGHDENSRDLGYAIKIAENYLKKKGVSHHRYYREAQDAIQNLLTRAEEALIQLEKYAVK